MEEESLGKVSPRGVCTSLRRYCFTETYPLSGFSLFLPSFPTFFLIFSVFSSKSHLSRFFSLLSTSFHYAHICFWVYKHFDGELPFIFCKTTDYHPHFCRTRSSMVFLSVISKYQHYAAIISLFFFLNVYLLYNTAQHSQLKEQSAGNVSFSGIQCFQLLKYQL